MKNLKSKSFGLSACAVYASAPPDVVYCNPECHPVNNVSVCLRRYLPGNSGGLCDDLFLVLTRQQPASSVVRWNPKRVYVSRLWAVAEQRVLVGRN
jgi:hypothetical protein